MGKTSAEVLNFPVRDMLPNGRERTVLIPVELTIEGDRIACNFGYVPSLIAEFKSMQGARYEGYNKTNPRKLWTISISPRNQWRMDSMRWLGLKADGTPVLGSHDPYERYDRPLIDVDCTDRPYYAHQPEGIRFILTRRQCVLAHDMGCVSGEAVVHISRAGKSWKSSLRDLYRSWTGFAKRSREAWRTLTIPTTIRSMTQDGKLRQNRIVNVLDKGVKQVVLLTLESGRKIKLTPDHEVAVSMDGAFKAAELLKPGDFVVANGQFIDKDGYVRVYVGFGGHPREWCGYVYEHILVMEATLGRSIPRSEEIHHKNRIRHDNRPENLEVLSVGDHKQEHDPAQHINGSIGFRGGEIWLAGVWDRVVSVEPAGEERVYDVVCEDPHRNFVADGIVVHNCGKTLVIIKSFEWCKDVLGFQDHELWYVCKKGALYQVMDDFIEWKSKARPRFMTYAQMTSLVASWPKGQPAPKFVVFDESTQIKSPTSDRSTAALHLANAIRAEHGPSAFIVCMTGTPSPKDPSDWWTQCEVACPGFIREGEWGKFRRRLCIIELREREDGGKYNDVKKDAAGNKLWYDNEQRCKTCGEFKEAEVHGQRARLESRGHNWEKSINEVLLIDSRLKGLVSKKFKKDCLDLPERVYKIIRCRPTQQLLNAAKLISKAARGAADAYTRLRELSDGFQYEQVTVDTIPCKMCAATGTMIAKQDPENPGLPISEEAIRLGRLEDVVRSCDECDGACEVDVKKRDVKRVACPKDDVLEELLEEHEDVGRLPIYCGFTGTVDRVVDVCLRNKWHVVRVDKRGWIGLAPEGAKTLPTDGRDLYRLLRTGLAEFPKLAFVSQASSGAHGLNFDNTTTIVNYSRDHQGENSLQGDERSMRGKIKETLKKFGRDKVTIVDIVHLPSDDLVLQGLKQKKRLQNMTLGEITAALDATQVAYERGQGITV